MEKDFGKCQVEVGIYNVRICNKKAVAKCEQCGKPVCQEHKVQLGIHTYCPDCALKITQNDPQYQKNPNLIPKTVWYYNSRYWVYNLLGLEPFYWRQYHYRDFDTYRYDDYVDDKTQDYFES